MLRLVAADAGAKASPLAPPRSNYIKSIEMKEYIHQADIRITCTRSHTHTHTGTDTHAYFLSTELHQLFFFNLMRQMLKNKRTGI